MARYLEGEELEPEAVAAALKNAVTRDELYPVGCGVATKNLGTSALLDLLVEGVPSPERKGTTIEFGDAKQAVFVFKTIADPFAGRISCFRVLAGPITGDTTLVDPRTHAKERLGQVLLVQGKDTVAGGRARRRRPRRRREAEGRRHRRRARRPRGAGRAAAHRLPAARDELRDHPEGEGRRGEDGRRAPPPQRGGPDARHAQRPADRRAAPLGALADAGRGGGRPARGPLPRRRRAAPAARPVQGDDPQGGARPAPVQEADRRPRPVRRLRDRDRAAARPPTASSATSSSTRSSAA